MGDVNASSTRELKLERLPDRVSAKTRKPRLAVAPVIALATVPKRLPRPLTEGEINTVHGELAPHVADALELCLQFGLRKREALTLEVADVDLEQGGIRLRGERTKGRRDEFLPASPAGLELLRRLVAQAEREGRTHLVLYRGPQGTRSAPERKVPRKQHPCGQ
jgi:integrase